MAPTLLLVPTPFYAVYYSCIRVRGSAADPTSMWRISLIAFFFMARAIFVVENQDGACARYYAGSLRFGNVLGVHHFLLPDMLLDALTYFRLHTFFLSTEIDQMLKTSEKERCVHANWCRTAAKNGYFGTKLRLARSLETWKSPYKCDT